MGAIEEIEAQGTLEPGQDGWWPVLGAGILDVEAGDVVVDTEGAYEVREVTGRTLTQVVLQTSEGEICVGLLARIKLIRKTNHNTLADTCGDGFAAKAKYFALPEVGAFSMEDRAGHAGNPNLVARLVEPELPAEDPETITVCADCVYFNEYGRLDDQTMNANPNVATEHAAKIDATWGDINNVRFTNGCGSDCEDHGPVDDRDDSPEPWFSSSACEECGSSLGGHREHATVWIVQH